jgi:putative flavoprotein involved in K+ transport
VERIDTVVIGAGFAGLAASIHLDAEGCDHVVLEAGRVGETWRSQRWDTFRMNTADGMNTLPGADLPDDGDRFGTHRELVAALEAAATRLPVVTRARVASVEPTRDGYEVRSGAGLLAARRVIVASGSQNRPRPARCRIGPLPSMLQIHSTGYRSAAALPPGAVLVVGGAQSGCQIAEDLAAHGRPVYLATSRVGRVPRVYRGRDMLAWWVTTGRMDERLADLPPGAAAARQPQVSGTGGTLSYQRLARMGVTVLGSLEAIGDGRAMLADDLAANVRFADDASARYRRDVDIAVAEHGFDAPPPIPDPDDEPDAVLSRARGPRSLDLAARGVASIIWCTGVTGEFGWLRVPIGGPNGLPQHREGLTSSPGLAVLGLPWLSRRASGILLGMGPDAERVVAQTAPSLRAR